MPEVLGMKLHKRGLSNSKKLSALLNVYLPTKRQLGIWVETLVIYIIM